MGRDEQHAFFLDLLNTVSAAQIARETGYSDGTVSQVKNGKYKGDEGQFLAKVVRVFGRWECPVQGCVVDHRQCETEQARPYSATRVNQWAACQKCERRSA